MMRFVRNQKGISLVQSIIALGILAMAMMVFVGAIQSMRTQLRSTLVVNSSEREVNEIIENVRAGIENYQIDYGQNKDLDLVLKPDQLPMAWDVGIQTELANCKNCAGRYGYVIQPFTGYRGLYLVTVRLTHKTWNEPYKDYQFTVTTK